MKKITTLFVTAAVVLLSYGLSAKQDAPKVTPTPTATVHTQTNPDKTEMLVHFIDVGQADSILVQNGGENMLIDGGNVKDSSLVVSYLKDYNVKTIDYLVCSHAHEDHCGGLNGPLRYFEVENVLAPETGSDADFYSDFLDGIYAQGIEITTPQAGYSFTLGDAAVQVVGPITEDTDEKNNTSLVLRLVDGENSFLFTGDAELEEEHDILDAGYDLSADVLKVGHHGARRSSSYSFLREVMPKYAVISVGKDNSYGHPTDDALSRLRDVGAEVYRTDLQGHIVATSDGENITFSTERN